MLRVVLGAVAILSLCAFSALAVDDQTKKDTKNAKADHPTKATITKVDAKHGTITVKMKNKNGKDEERTFHLTEDVRYFDSTGKAVAIDVFKSGNEVLVVEREGKLKEVRQDKKATDKHDEKSTDKKSANNNKK